MDSPPEQQKDAGMNMTRALEALSPYLNHPRHTVIEIECLVALAVALLWVQLLLGAQRRRSGHWFLRLTLWLAYAMSFPLMTYTFSQMVTSPVKNVMYPIWAVLLLWAAGCANSMTVYSLEENKQWRRFVFDLLQYFGYIFIIALLLDPRSPRRPSSFAEFRRTSKLVVPQPIEILVVVLATVVCYTNVIRIVAAWNVTNSTRSKLVADYMRIQVETTGREEPLSFDPVTMKGYTYLVWFRGNDSRLRRGVGNGMAISIDKIWDMAFDDDLRNTTQDSWQLRLVCLSFALSHLLRRRFFGLDCAEAAHPETRRFALEGLLTEDDEANHYSTAFGIIEVELGFLYDFFFTKYGTLFDLEYYFLTTVLLKVICTWLCGMFMILYSPSIMTPDPIIEVGTRRVDIIATVFIMGALLIFEALQVALYLTSDWATVSLVCNLILKYCNPLLSIAQFLTKYLVLASKKMFGRISSFGYWQNQMGQSSVIECCLRANSSFVNPMIVSNVLQGLQIPIFMSHIMAFFNKTFQVVPGVVRSEIVSCLRKHSDSSPLTNGGATLHLNGVLAEFSWALLENDSQTVVMLIWHIATEYCSIASSHEDSEVHHQSGARQQDNYEQVATSLSKYCAYLMFFIPELLPGNSTDTAFVLNDAILEGCHLLGKGKPTRDKLLKVITDYEDNNDNEDRSPEVSIFVKGLKLGRDLEKEDVVTRWKVLAEFWAETIIYIAPTDNAVAHMERLARGGEFLTHVWALLTHAGILRRG